MTTPDFLRNSAVVSMKHRADRLLPFNAAQASVGLPSSRRILGMPPFPFDDRGAKSGATPGEIGKTLSKLAAIRVMAGSGDFTLWEDDARPCADFVAKASAAIASLPDDWDVCVLGSVGGSTTGGISRVTPSSVPEGLQCIVVRGQRAEAVFKALHPANGKVGDMLVASGLAIYQLVPSLAWQAQGYSDVSFSDRPARNNGPIDEDRLPAFLANHAVISLRGRTDKQKAVSKEFSSVGLGAPNFFWGLGPPKLGVKLPLSPGATGCYLSHLALLRMFDDGRDFTVWEDDAVPCANFVHRAGDIIKSLPSDWDVCFLGSTDWIPPKNGAGGRAFVKVGPEGATGTQCYVVRGGSTERLLQGFDHMQLPYDLALSRCPYANIYRCTPSLVGQAAGVSDVTGMRTSLTNLGVLDR